MVPPWLPVPSLLGLLGALLMLSPELLMGLSDVPVTDEGVQKALGFAVEQYNEKIGCRNYFKQLRLLQALTQGDPRDQYHLKVELVITACRKKPDRRMKYERIQRCKQRPGNPEKRICHLQVNPLLLPNETLDIVVCALHPPPNEVYCSD